MMLELCSARNDRAFIHALQVFMQGRIKREEGRKRVRKGKRGRSFGGKDGKDGYSEKKRKGRSKIRKGEGR